MILTKTKMFATVFALLALTIAARDALALSTTERHGRTLAVRLCAQCHAIGKSGASPHIGAPPFRHLESRVDLDAFQRRLRQGLMTSHRDMPVFRFTRDDARAMVAYLRSIQGP
jgi:mono/diheme cytochrome c family protein